jgi:hypothetical protein
MPLKEPDLKDTETYKKASRVDLPKVASGNAKFWIYKDVELPNSSGKKQKYPAFLALVDDNGIRKAMTGKKLICKGTCSLKEEKIAFEPTTGTVPYKQLKASLPLLLGKAVWIPTGQEDAGEEGEAEETAPTPPAPQAQSPGTPPPQPQAAATPPAQPPGAPPLTAASLTGAWTKLVKDVQAYAAAHPERKADLFRDLAAIGALLKANQAAEAKPKMDKMQAVLDAPPAPPAQPPGAPPLTVASLTGAWTKLVKDVQAYAAAHPERKADLFRDMAAIGALLKANQAAEAKPKMDKMQAALDAPPATEGKPAAAPAGEGKPAAEKAKEKEGEEEEADEGEDEEEEKEAAEFRKDVKGKMVTALAQVKSRAPREGEEPKPQLRFMAYLAGKSNAVLVAKKVGSGSKKLLAEIASASGGKIVMGECIFEKGVHTFVLAKVPGGLAKKLTVALLAETGTKYRVRVRAIDGSVDLDSETDVDPDEKPADEAANVSAALPVWQEAKEAVDAQLGQLYDTLKRGGIPVFETAANQIEGVLAGYRTGLVKALAEYDGASGGAKEKARANALQVVADYQARIPKDKHIIAADTNPFGVNVTARETLGAALAGLSKQLTS